ncbi:MAG TPA: c-type cytochrome biogenesis protein CcsB, partial [Geodermatophilus sp.]|nr:c-type cytochrome biogenesis protein CcsB [Geodermatophilus sp.]
MTVDQSLADLSDTLFSIAVALYSIAVVAFSAQLAFGRRPARQLVSAGTGAPADAPATPARSDRWGL